MLRGTSPLEIELELLSDFPTWRYCKRCTYTEAKGRSLRSTKQSGLRKSNETNIKARSAVANGSGITMFRFQVTD